MARSAFKLRIKQGKQRDYIERHQAVWPELLRVLKEVGISNYSIFLRGQELFLYLEVADFQEAWQKLDQAPVNQEWQQYMAPLFEPVPDLQPGERFAMLEEVFHLD